MENGGNPKEKESSSSPNTTTSSSSSHHHGSGNEAFPAGEAATLTPKSTPRAVDLNPQLTTFIHANSSTFKQVVQMLTGSLETTAKHAAAATLPPLNSKPITPLARATCPKKPAFKLYERRSSMKNLKMISPLIPAFSGASNPNSPATAFFPGQQGKMLSPSILDLPSLVLSPVTPLISDPFGRSPEPGSAEAAKAEERGIAEKGFYFHPSPRMAEPPTLLPLFPTTSPRVSSLSSL